MKIGKYSIGVGDRFAHEAGAQLKALVKAKKELGIDITPVWNKSNREHNLIGSNPSDTRRVIDATIGTAKWDGDYFLDADHINLSNVDRFLEPCDFFTLDVADYIGKPSSAQEIETFLSKYGQFAGTLNINGLEP
ncbi:MAG: hypothetical protein HC830_10670, partial [Bacteroidetes bacterium]|nr:hypothetical protein [Bacteroidota bacterium]